MSTLRALSGLAAIFQLAFAAEDIVKKDICKPNYAFTDAKAACAACQDCRDWNKCPCTSFSKDGQSFFCFDSFAPDMLWGKDLHKYEMHCDVLTSGATQQCAENMVANAMPSKAFIAAHKVFMEEDVEKPENVMATKLYSFQPKRLESAFASPIGWAASTSMVLVVLGIFSVLHRRSAEQSPSAREQNRLSHIPLE